MIRFKALLLFLYALPVLAGELHFEKGNQAYARGQYENAATEYRQLLDANRTSAAVHFNLANAYHQISRERDEGQVRGATQLGRAIYHYRMARRMDPRTRIITSNLQQARERVHGQAPRERAWRVLLGFFTVNEWAIVAWLTLAAWLLLMTAGCVHPVWRARWRAWLPLLGGAGIALTILAGLAWKTQAAGNEAVAVRDIPVFKRPLAPEEVPNNVAHAEPDALREGIEMDIIERQENGWLKVAFVDGLLNRSGWVREGAMERPNLLIFPR